MASPTAAHGGEPCHVRNVKMGKYITIMFFVLFSLGLIQLAHYNKRNNAFSEKALPRQT